MPEPTTRKYRIDIPRPTAKRLEFSRQVFLTTMCGLRDEPDMQLLAMVPEGLDHVVVEAPSILEDRDPDVDDSHYWHEFLVEYRSMGGTRVEQVIVTPTPVEG